MLDLGSGAGADVLISARRVGPTGKAIGLDMTDEMLELARANAAQAGVENVEFVKGYIEDIPLPDGSVDVIVSNCVLNLSGDKPKVLREAARVLRAGGRFAVSDVIASPDMDDATRADLAAYTGCIAGAFTEDEFRDGSLPPGSSTSRFAPPTSPRVRELGDHPRPQAGLVRRTETRSARHVELFEPAMCCSVRRLRAVRRPEPDRHSGGHPLGGDPRRRGVSATTCPPTRARLSPTQKSPA